MLDSERRMGYGSDMTTNSNIYGMITTDPKLAAFSFDPRTEWFRTAADRDRVAKLHRGIGNTVEYTDR